MVKKSSYRAIQFQSRTFTLLFDGCLRPLTPPERERLRASIETDGILCAVIIDESDGVLDGIHRLEIAAELGLPLDAVPFSVRRGLTPQDKERIAFNANDARRQMTAADRAEAAAKMRAKGMSRTRIADELGVDEKTIRNDEKRSGSEKSEPEHPSKISGKDGKTYHANAPAPVETEAKKQKAKQLSEGCASVRQIAKELDVSLGTAHAYVTAPDPVADEPIVTEAESEDDPPEREILTDEADQDIPEHVEPAFRDRPKLRKLLKALDDIAREIEALAKSSSVLSLVHWQSAQHRIQDARKSLFQGRPAYVCPYCKAMTADCRACKGKGFVTKVAWDAAPPEMKTASKNR